MGITVPSRERKWERSTRSVSGSKGRLERSSGSMPPVAMACWQGLKSVAFLLSLAGALAYLCWDEFTPTLNLRIVMACIIGWQFWEQVIARRRYGISHILLTSKGVLFTEENVYVKWEDIESYMQHGDMLRFKPAPGCGPRGLFARSELDIPLSKANREFVLDLFKERVTRWKPEA